MDERELSVVIPVRDHQAYVSECLKSVFRQSPLPEEVLVVDRGSVDATLALVADRFRGVRILRSRRACGFSRALNRGIGHCRHGLIAVVMPEVKMERGYFGALMEALNSPEHGGAAFATGKILRMFGGRGILDSAGLAHEGGSMLPVKRGEGRVDDGAYDSLESVDGAARGAVIYRRTMLKSLGPDGEVFDETLHGSFEDVDLSCRARRGSFRGVYVPSAVAYADLRRPGRTPAAEAAYECSRLMVALKNMPAGALWKSLSGAAAEGLKGVIAGRRGLKHSVYAALLLSKRLMEVRRRRQETFSSMARENPKRLP